jgi:hypothetical protein
MRDFSNIPPWSPCPELHEEQDPTIDRALQATAHALRMGMSEEQALAHVHARGIAFPAAVNIVRAATVLSDHDD